MSSGFFNDKAAAPEKSKTGRILFAMDATASRSHTWQSVSAIHKDMFSAINGIGELEVMLMYFRGLSECRAAPWLKDQATLLKLLDKVTCEMGETQILRVLEHASKEHDKAPVHAIIYIGDFCEEEFAGIETKAEILGMKKVPIFVFHDQSGENSLLFGRNPETKAIFKYMAEATKGAYMHLDTRSSKILSHLLQAVAIYATGGRKALENYSKQKGVNDAVLQLTAQLG